MLGEADPDTQCSPLTTGTNWFSGCPTSAWLFQERTKRERQVAFWGGGMDDKIEPQKLVDVFIPWKILSQIKHSPRSWSLADLDGLSLKSAP